MPDHAHALVEGEADSSDLCRLVHDWKQSSGHAWKHATGTELWQRGYFDHVLRSQENTDFVAGYILMNPVRAGLVTHPRDYPYCGSDTSTIEDLLLRRAQVEWSR